MNRKYTEYSFFPILKINYIFAAIFTKSQHLSGHHSDKAMKEKLLCLQHFHLWYSRTMASTEKGPWIYCITPHATFVSLMSNACWMLMVHTESRGTQIKFIFTLFPKCLHSRHSVQEPFIILTQTIARLFVCLSKHTKKEAPPPGSRLHIILKHSLGKRTAAILLHSSGPWRLHVFVN